MENKILSDKKIELTLRNLLNKEQKLTLSMDVFENSISQRWIQELEKALIRKDRVVKDYSFLGWPNTHRNIEFLCNELNREIETINEFSNSGKWNKPYNILDKFTKETILNSDNQLNQETMNILHHHFALLFGQVWNPSYYMMNSPRHIQDSIGRLNLRCHEIENYVGQQETMRKHGYDAVAPGIIFSLEDCPRHDLLDQDYELFEYRQFFGAVSLHYCQVGKRYDEAFEDRDQVASSEEICGLRYYSGEFNIYWGLSHDDYYSQRLKAIKDWIASIGKDPNDKKLSLGFIHLGEFNRQKNFGNASLKEIHDLISAHADIYSVKIIDQKSETIASHCYDY
ncbi:MAG: hypothetical protein K2P81_16895 [Bacteriovoracaceae bacterium]|nr:hypothetical protein [Bacteriovoracaceae bacterium]